MFYLNSDDVEGKRFSNVPKTDLLHNSLYLAYFRLFRYLWLIGLPMTGP